MVLQPVVMHTPAYPSRELTRREELLLRIASMSPAPTAPPRKAPDILIDGIVADVVARPFRIQSPVFRPRFHFRAAEDRLLEELSTSAIAGDERAEAARLLAAIGSRRSLPALMMLYRNPQTRESALAGIVRLADAPILAALVTEETTPPGDRPSLISAMLRRDPARGARLLIPMIRDAELSRPAMAALDTVAAPEFPASSRRVVVAALFEELRGPRIDDRMAAARALGRIDGPETAARLIEMADRNDCRREALAALIWCGGRSASATAALEAARRSPRLASTVRSLELTLGEAPI
jgi:HEAT repeat protein